MIASVKLLLTIYIIARNYRLVLTIRPESEVDFYTINREKYNNKHKLTKNKKQTRILTIRNKKCVVTHKIDLRIKKIMKTKKGCNTRTSQGVTHPSTTLAQARLTSEF